MKAGIMGCGVIGGTLLRACQTRCVKVCGYDIAKPELGPFEDLLDADLILLCLPTPTKYGEQDVSALKSAILRLSQAKYKGSVAIRSTVLPGTTAVFAATFPKLNFIHNPEFLTEANAAADLLNQGTVLLGGKKTDVAKAFWKEFDPGVVVKCYPDSTTTEMAKYIHNCFLAVKVGFCNEIYALCQNIGAQYDSATEAASFMGKVGWNHTKVPGPDGKLGFGGMCFVKDTASLLKFMQDFGLSAEILASAIVANKRRRPEAYDGTENTGNT